jgi:peptidoglycan/LPS O-acetylase OafA/YrhL
MLNPHPVHLAGLNGLRAIAAIAVLISHITQSLNLFNLNPYIFGSFTDGNPKGMDLGGFGVSIFFALSGFLITYLLLLEKDKIKKINIGKFYVRRLLRIWPLYYLYIALVFLVYILFEYAHKENIIYYYIFFGANIPFILGTTLPFLAHYWSIGVEEQFYLFWPWLFKNSPLRLLNITILLIVLLIGAKTYLHLFVPNSIFETVIHVTRFHCMLIGAAGAILFYLKNELFLKFTTNIISQVFCWGIIFLASINRFHFASFLDNEIISIISTVLIMGQITKRSFINLETKGFDFVGKISYGIYVIHPLIIFLFSQLLKDLPLKNIAKYSLVYSTIIGVTLLLSYISYHYFEKRFLILKDKKFSIIVSSNTIQK